jgi:hypothetical protein
MSANEWDNRPDGTGGSRRAEALGYGYEGRLRGLIR